MSRKHNSETLILEICLIIVSLGLACLMYQFQGYKMVVLNLFYLPVVLTGFFLGRYHAGVLALFSVIAASLIAVLQLESLALNTSPLVMAMSVAIWGAVLGMTALLVGTLSDERQRTSSELHEAYVGVVEVLANYLQGAHPRLKARSIRIAELSQKVAEAIRLSPKQVDDIRVASLLYDLGNVEITSKVIRRALGNLDGDPNLPRENTFLGSDLLISLGPVLSDAMPLLRNAEPDAFTDETNDERLIARELPVGAQIIQLTRKYDELTEDESSGPISSSAEAIESLQRDPPPQCGPQLLDALERVVSDRPIVKADEFVAAV